AAMHRAGRTDRRRVVRVRAGWHRFERRFVAQMSPRLIDFAGRRGRPEPRTRHSEWLEQTLAHQILPRLPGDPLHDRADDGVTGIGINPLGARRLLRLVGEDAADEGQTLFRWRALLL